MIDIGNSRNVIVETIQLMIDLGLIKEVDNCIYEVVSCEADI